MVARVDEGELSPVWSSAGRHLSSQDVAQV
jgi:hypothetical protein